MSCVLKTLRIVFGLVFIAAAVSKAAYPLEFAGIVANYRILPDSLVNPVALGLPWIELVCGAALITGVAVRGAALTLVLLLCAFTAALGYNVSRGLSVACGCFSVSAEPAASMRADLIRDGVILALGLTVFVLALVEDRRRRASARFWREFYAPPQSSFGEPKVQDGVLIVGSEEPASRYSFGKDAWELEKDADAPAAPIAMPAAEDAAPGAADGAGQDAAQQDEGSPAAEPGDDKAR